MDDNYGPILAREINRPECKAISMESISEDIQQDSIYNLNIRGLNNNLSSLEEFLGQIEHREHVKAITLTEIFNADHQEKKQLCGFTHTGLGMQGV